MKIIGRQGADYIVTISESEISLSMGFGPYAGDDFKKATADARDLSSYGGKGDLRSGASLEIHGAHQFVRKAFAEVEAITKAAGNMRALADLITQPIEALLVVVPEEPPPPSVPTARDVVVGSGYRVEEVPGSNLAKWWAFAPGAVLGAEFGEYSSEAAAMQGCLNHMIISGAK